MTVRAASSRSWRLAVKVPAAWSTVACVTTPSPQSMSTVCVSWGPASVKEPVTVATPFSLIADPEIDATTGATLFTRAVSVVLKGVWPVPAAEATLARKASATLRRAASLRNPPFAPATRT